MDIIRAYIHYVNSIVKKYPHAVHKYLHCLRVRAKKKGPKSLFFQTADSKNLTCTGRRRFRLSGIGVSLNFDLS